MTDSRLPGDFPPPSVLKELGDGDLVRLLVQGYGDAMTVVFDRYYTPMMRLALRIMRNRAEAEDVVQTAFADFYRQIKLFDESKGNLRAWLLQYVYGRCINRINTLKVRHHNDHIELSDVPPSELSSTDQRFLNLNEPESKRLVEQVLGKLNENKRRIVELICLDGLTLKDVAMVTQEPRTRIQNLYYRAIAELRATVREPEAPPTQPGKEPQTAEEENHKRAPNLKVSREEVEIG